METFPALGRFPATDLRICHVPRCLIHRMSPARSFFTPLAVNSCREHGTSVSENPNRMFVLGMGFVGKFFARELNGQGWAVCGSCTSLAKKKKIEEMGFDAYLFDANEPGLEVLNLLNHHTHLLISIPPIVGIGDPTLQHEELLKSSLRNGNLNWIGYLSSTSVYGNCGGFLVDEEYPVSPADDRTRGRLAAENGWLKFGQDLGISTQIFRLGGIYGPGRSAVDTIIKQEPLSEFQRTRASRHYTSRVHVADICQALMASIHKPSPSAGQIYNIVDDDPAPRTQVFAYALDLVDRKWPGHMKQISPLHVVPPVPAKSNSSGEKRVSNVRVKNELGVKLLHPSYRSGLESIVQHMNNPFL